MHRAHAAPLALLLACASLAGCGHQSNDVQVGLKKISLDLAFKSKTKVPPPPLTAVAATPQVPPQVVVATGSLPTLPSIAPLPTVPNRPGVLPALAPFTCPTA